MRRGRARRGGLGRRGTAPLGEPLFIAPGARNRAERSGRDDAGAAGADSPSLEWRPPDGGQWRRLALTPRPPGTSPTATSKVSTGHPRGWLYSKRGDLQHERLKLDRRWDFPRRAQNLRTLYRKRGWEERRRTGEARLPLNRNRMEPSGAQRNGKITWPVTRPQHVPSPLALASCMLFPPSPAYSVLRTHALQRPNAKGHPSQMKTLGPTELGAP